MTKKAKIDVADLESRLGHRFRDRDGLARALTHLSSPAAGGPDRSQSYQRLEFLGDRVLGIVVAHMLYEAYPQASEGELSMRLAKLVRRETCADVALEWDVGPHVAMGQGEARAGGRKKMAILADVCEAIIGAVFLDAGFAAASDVVTRTWRARMDANLEPERDAKTAVQEWAQARALPAPRYVEAARSGPAHAPHFVMQVVLDGYEPESGEANSKRAAEQAAAQAFLTRWGSS
ncbi:MAG: ribonuclease III [Bradyrhizobium sp.]|nr:MAG: ribonuclease III [Bradyrhizobium sp.]